MKVEINHRWMTYLMKCPECDNTNEADLWYFKNKVLECPVCHGTVEPIHIGWVDVGGTS